MAKSVFDRGTITPEDKKKAIRALVYEMLMLAAALREWNERETRDTRYPSLRFGPPQVLYELIQVKLRLLSDFLKLRKTPPNNDDIVIRDFGEMGKTHEHLKTLREGVNKWSAHLTWQRVRNYDLNAPRPNHNEVVREAVALLGEARKFVERQRAAGVELPEVGVNYLAAYLEERQKLEVNNRRLGSSTSSSSSESVD